jgi:hypothetical protein
MLVTAGLLAVGCSAVGAGPASTAVPAPASAPAEAVPAFDGPWADWFATVYTSQTTTEGQRAILADGVITDTEYAQVRADFAQCLEDLGLTVVLDPGGGFTIDENDHLSDAQVTEDAVPTCEETTVGSVGLLYEQIRRNPEQKDEATIVVDCLHDAGIVDSGYTAAEYQRDLDAYTGLDWDSRDVRACTEDPLGLLDAATGAP